jgi:hypothetical protein
MLYKDIPADNDFPSSSMDYYQLDSKFLMAANTRIKTNR